MFLFMDAHDHKDSIFMHSYISELFYNFESLCKKVLLLAEYRHITDSKLFFFFWLRKVVCDPAKDELLLCYETLLLLSSSYSFSVVLPV